MPSIPTADALTAQLESAAAARDAATACKRKLQRVVGAVEVLDELIGDGVQSPDLSQQLLDAEADTTRTHEELVALLEATDGGEDLKRPRAEWFEAAGACEFVRSHDLLHQYLPAVEREVAEARERWEATAGPRAQLKSLKASLAKVQGRLYALLELGFRLPDAAEVMAQRDRWGNEVETTRSQLAAQSEALAARKTQLEAFHREQGWRKGAERFGAQAGMSEDHLLSARMKVLEADATMLRLTSRASLTLLAAAHEAHEHALAALHAAAGQMGALQQMRTQACTSEQLGAEEYEAGLESEVIRGTLTSLAPRASEALHLRLAWHSKVGARKAGEALHAPNLAELDAALDDARRMADAAEPLRREEAVLRAKLSKLQVGAGRVLLWACWRRDRARARTCVVPHLCLSFC